MRTLLLLLAAGVVPVSSALGLTLDLPVRTPGVTSAVGGPAYRGDLIELRLRPASARAARPRVGGRPRSDALGVRGVDRRAIVLGGVWFEPEFRNETPPPAGSDEPDFTVFYLAHLPAGVP